MQNLGRYEIRAYRNKPYLFCSTCKKSVSKGVTEKPKTPVAYMALATDHEIARHTNANPSETEKAVESILSRSRP